MNDCLRYLVFHFLLLSYFHEISHQSCRLRKSYRPSAREPTCSLHADCFYRYLLHVPSLGPQSQSVTCLDLSMNRISDLPSGVFNRLESLTKLDLRRNRIRVLRSGVFQGLSFLTSLNMQANRIREIAPGVFHNLSSLEYLNLVGNEIAELKSEVFRDLNSLNVLDLKGNQIHTVMPEAFKGLNTLKSLEMGANRISQLPFRAFKSLTKLQRMNLAWNMISKLDRGVFHDLNNTLEELDIKGNMVSEVKKATFNGLTSLRKLNLAWNKVTIIESGALHGLSKLKELDLRRNQVKCACSMIQEIKGLRKSNLIHIFGTCDRVKKLAELTNQLSMCDCGTSSLNEQCVSSKWLDARKGEFPWQVCLTVNNKFHCGGSLLTSDLVLTAAHCFNHSRLDKYPSENRKFEVFLGCHKQCEKEAHCSQRRNVASVTLHPKYKWQCEKNKYDDLALLRLGRRVRFTKHILPICLPTNTIQRKQDSMKTGFVPGWGGLNVTGILQKLCVHPITQTKCNASISNNQYITPNSMCVNESLKKGDSGGGLVFFDTVSRTWFLDGVLSHRIKERLNHIQYTVFTRANKSVVNTMLSNLHNNKYVLHLRRDT